MIEIVSKFNEIRHQTEGNLAEAHKAAKAAGLPQSAVEYLALSVSWRDYAIGFRLLCENMAEDDSLPVFWRASACESLGATTPAGQEADRLDWFNQALQLVESLDSSDIERLYIETCVKAGRNETPGQERSLEVFSEVAAIMVSQGWFNAPGRLKAYLDELTKTGGDINTASDLVAAYRQAETEGTAAFSKRQDGFLKGAYPALFAAA